ncbi:MAG: hypothetical protein BGO98_04225 [Myxococcales bacterium 68-20]|nr:MAG: hypothetical protein BGO98_04225 [Myxococcales bacterium 68-20]
MSGSPQSGPLGEPVAKHVAKSEQERPDNRREIERPVDGREQVGGDALVREPLSEEERECSCRGLPFALVEVATGNTAKYLTATFVQRVKNLWARPSSSLPCSVPDLTVSVAVAVTAFGVAPT